MFFFNYLDPRHFQPMRYFGGTVLISLASEPDCGTKYYKGMIWEKYMRRETLLKIIYYQSERENLKPETILKINLLSQTEQLNGNPPVSLLLFIIILFMRYVN